ISRVLLYVRYRGGAGADRGELGLPAFFHWRERGHFRRDGSIYCAVSERARADARSAALLFLYRAHTSAADFGLLVRDPVLEWAKHSGTDQSRRRGLVGAHRRIYPGDDSGLGPAPAAPAI